MADASSPGGGGFDYVQDSTNSPTSPKLGDEWYQPDQNDAKVYDGTEWKDLKISDHTQLSNVSEGQHFSPGGGLTFSAGALELLLSGYLELDGNGDLAIAAGSIGQDRLGFDTATQNDLTTHVNDESNPHNVTDDQTGAQQALNSHASDESNPHNVTDDQTGAADALAAHASDPDAHQSKVSPVQVENNLSVPAGGSAFVSGAASSTPFNAFVQSNGAEGVFAEPQSDGDVYVYNKGDGDTTVDLYVVEY